MSNNNLWLGKVPFLQVPWNWEIYGNLSLSPISQIQAAFSNVAFLHKMYSKWNRLISFSLIYDPRLIYNWLATFSICFIEIANWWEVELVYKTNWSQAPKVSLKCDRQCCIPSKYENLIYLWHKLEAILAWMLMFTYHQLIEDCQLCS